MSWSIRILVLFLFVFTLGCEKKSPGIHVGEKEISFENLDPSDIMVTVDGDSFTKKDLMDQVEVMTTFQFLNKKVSDSRKKKFERFVSRQAVHQFVRSSLLSNYAKRKGFMPSKKEYEDFRAVFAKRYFDEDVLKKNFGEKAKDAYRLLEKMMKRELIVNTLRTRYFADQLQVRDSEVDDVLKNVHQFNDVAKLTNAAVYAHATNIWNRLKSGENFEKLADTFSESEHLEKGGKWGTFSSQELFEPELRSALATMKECDFSPPVEADGGLAIVKVNKIIKMNSNSDISIFQFERGYDLSYIFFRLPMFYDIPSRDQIKKMEWKNKVNKLYSKLLPEMLRESSVVYPNGNKFFPSAKSIQKGKK